MNPIPSAPTDNLWKFLAIVGVWGMVFVFGSLLFVVYKNYEIELFNKQQYSIKSEEGWIKRANQRIASIDAGRMNENIIFDTWANSNSAENEKMLLRNSVELSTQRINELKASMSPPDQTLFPFLEKIYFYWILVVSSVLFAILLIVGFMQWMRLQKITDSMLKIEFQLKNKELGRKPYRGK